MRRDEVLAILKKHQQELEELGVKSLAVFGSVARDEAGVQSDVDLLVELEEGRAIGLFGFIGIQQHLESLLERKVDLVTLDYMKPKMRSRVLNDALSVFPMRDWKLEYQKEIIPNVPPRSWKDRIEDILDSIAKIERYIQNMSFEEFEADEVKVDAVLRQLTIIGEAARYTPSEVEANNPQIAWHQMRGIRNRVVHDYPDVSLAIVWDTITNHLPPLVTPLRELLESEDIT